MNLRTLVASTLAAALLSASVTGTATWALARDRDPGPVPTAAEGQVDVVEEQPRPEPEPEPEPGPRMPDLTPPGASLDTGSPTAPATEATADQSRGVVLIETTLIGGEAAGTGLVLESSGLVLTNYHVVEGSTSAVVTVATDGTTYDAEVLGFDAESDIALLQLEGAAGLETVVLDDDGDPAVSDAVTAVGNAEGQGYLSAASGTVVALEQSITTASSRTAAGEDLDGLIQTDAAVVGGYSGGALLDDEGEVVGVTTAASSGGPPESYAVPLDDALAVVERIEAGDESGDVQVGASAYLGLGLVETTSGLGVAEVEAGSAADEAGIVAGDLLLGLGDRTVTSVDLLRAVLATYEPGARTTLRWRSSDGTAHTAPVTLGSSPVA